MSGEKSNAGAEKSGIVYLFARDNNGTYKQRLIVKKAVPEADERFGYFFHGALLDETNIYVTTKKGAVYFYPHGLIGTREGENLDYSNLKLRFQSLTDSGLNQVNPLDNQAPKVIFAKLPYGPL